MSGLDRSAAEHHRDLPPEQAILLAASLADIEDGGNAEPVMCLDRRAIDAAADLAAAGHGHVTFTACTAYRQSEEPKDG